MVSLTTHRNAAKIHEKVEKAKHELVAFGKTTLSDGTILELK